MVPSSSEALTIINVAQQKSQLMEAGKSIRMLIDYAVVMEVVRTNAIKTKFAVTQLVWVLVLKSIILKAKLSSTTELLRLTTYSGALQPYFSA